ncbi:cysteine desulfurase family protein [Bradyrhizobium sp. LHD-71]|uniref:cysteine desulfurase family protein n=1 Tax=Bradyrhizobium sp. LHD-71 TaxID=3072141 RepID=UPI00280F2999|nr:cysteine desulfurase family protein [Bradyrhizobium sp. LHD-71]MDQ8731562.1 cysteine desulfurase family protein [Bradyrhizobium sp. LHD-71]
MISRIYLDWNATAPLRPEARAAVTAALDIGGNPSSVHAEGRAARRLVEHARAQLAACIGAKVENVIFTSGGTEANAQALVPGWSLGGRVFDRLIVSAIEHPSVLSGGHFSPSQVVQTPVSRDGVVDLGALGGLLAEPALVSIMLANNETGALQPISEAAALVHRAGGILHVDVVQGLGRLPLDPAALGADIMTLSGHKIGGPKGVGALVIVNTDLHAPQALIRGGGQERNHRAGTENVAGIAGFGAAATAARSQTEADAVKMRALRDRLEAGLRSIAGVTVFSAGVPRLPNTTLFALRGVRAETAVIAFDLEGVAVSSGSACSSGKVQPSHVLAAMGIEPELSRGAIRISTGPTTKASEIDRCLEAWRMLSGVLRRG